MVDRRHVFAAALGTHVLAVVFTTVTGLNPDASGDADVFARIASSYATAVRHGAVPAVDPGSTESIWSAFLAPFWLVPGPSRVYARLANAALGAFAAYNVYTIAATYHSRRAGAVAALPLVAYPSVLSSHSTVLREALILFGLTTVAHLYLLRRFHPPWHRHLVAAAVMVPVVLQRSENLPVYLLVFAVAAAWSRLDVADLNRGVSAVFLAVLLPLSAWVYPKASAVVRRLARLRRRRAGGRTVYLGEVFPETIPAALAFSWIGFAYFLYTPFPWMVARPIDLLIAVEGAVNLLYTLAAVAGTRVLARRTPAGAAALLTGIVVGGVLYGLGTANVGTAVRHRQMLLWALFLLGGIGFANAVSFRIRDSLTESE